MIRIADFGTRIEAYDRLPTEPAARRLAWAQRAEKGDDWRGWQVWPAPAGTPATFPTKREARDLVALLADRELAELAGAADFYVAQLARLAAAIGRRNGAGVIAVLEYLAAEGDRETAEALADYMTSAGVLEVIE